MSRNTIENVISYIKSLKKQSTYLGIAWYGGEPLLALEIIEEITKIAILEFGDDFSASMVTNGYLLSEDVAKRLETLKIESIQVTIDGPPEMHNRMRKLPNGDDTFL